MGGALRGGSTRAQVRSASRAGGAGEVGTTCSSRSTHPLPLLPGHFPCQAACCAFWQPPPPEKQLDTTPTLTILFLHDERAPDHHWDHLGALAQRLQGVAGLRTWRRVEAARAQAACTHPPTLLASPARGNTPACCAGPFHPTAHLHREGDVLEGLVLAEGGAASVCWEGEGARVSTGRVGGAGGCGASRRDPLTAACAAAPDVGHRHRRVAVGRRHRPHVLAVQLQRRAGAVRLVGRGAVVGRRGRWQRRGDAGAAAARFALPARFALRSWQPTGGLGDEPRPRLPGGSPPNSKRTQLPEWPKSRRRPTRYAPGA